jgi:hypothetical protein
LKKIEGGEKNKLKDYPRQKYKKINLIRRLLGLKSLFILLKKGLKKCFLLITKANSSVLKIINAYICSLA